MNFENRFFKHIYNFLSGKDDGLGKSLTDRWYRSFNDSEGFFEDMQPSEKQERRKQILNNIEEDLGIKEAYKASLKEKGGKRFSFSYLSIAAVTMMVGIFISFIVMNEFDFDTSGNSDAEFTSLTSVTGEVVESKLMDGTSVWLSTESTIHIPENFNEDERVVFLEGEAFFDVVHNRDKPFIVKSGEVSSRVLGTSFTIKSYPGETTKVTLASGKVRITALDAHEEQVLSENQQISYNKRNGFSEIVTVDAAIEQAWMNRELIFMRESFAHIARTFERWYGVEFIFKDEALKNQIFVYHFTEYSLEESLNKLKLLADFEYEYINKQVFIDSVQ